MPKIMSFILIFSTIIHYEGKNVHFEMKFSKLILQNFVKAKKKKKKTTFERLVRWFYCLYGKR